MGATEIYTDLHTLSLHDALPISVVPAGFRAAGTGGAWRAAPARRRDPGAGNRRARGCRAGQAGRRPSVPPGGARGAAPVRLRPRDRGRGRGDGGRRAHGAGRPRHSGSLCRRAFGTGPRREGGVSDNGHSAAHADRGPVGHALRGLLRAVGLGRNGHSGVRASLEELIEENGEDAPPIDPHEGAIIRNVLGLRDITAYDAMVPRADIVAVEQSVTLSEVARLMGGAAHSRMPIYRGTLDDVIGLVHIKDVT